MQEQRSREQAMLVRMREQADADKSEMEKAKDLLKMKSVKIQRATTADVRRRPSSECQSSCIPYPPLLWQPMGWSSTAKFVGKTCVIQQEDTQFPS